MTSMNVPQPKLTGEAQNQKAQTRLKLLLLEGLNSPASEMTTQDWRDVRREVRERLAQRSRSTH